MVRGPISFVDLPELLGADSLSLPELDLHLLAPQTSLDHLVPQLALTWQRDRVKELDRFRPLEDYPLVLDRKRPARGQRGPNQLGERIGSDRGVGFFGAEANDEPPPESRSNGVGSPSRPLVDLRRGGAIAPFPEVPFQTGRADFPHPAYRWSFHAACTPPGYRMVPSN